MALIVKGDATMKINMILIIFLLMSIVVSSSCSSTNQSPNFQREENPFGGDRQWMNNLSDEERQEMIEQRQQISIDACEAKEEGDNCILENPRGEMEGTCQINDDVLVCVMDRPPVGGPN